MQQRSRQGTSSVLEVVLIVIITTITIINCKEIERSTVPMSITDTGSITRHGFISTIVPNDQNPSASSESPTDACKIDQALIINDIPVRLKAFTGPQ